MAVPQIIFIIIGGIGLCVTLFGVVLLAYNLGRVSGLREVLKMLEALHSKGSSDEL